VSTPAPDSCYSRRVSKLRVGIVFGGRSTEHPVSIRSATTIVNAIDRSHYEPVLIGIDPEGNWRVSDADGDDRKVTPASVFEDSSSHLGVPLLRDGLDIVNPRDHRTLFIAPLDVIFPIIHGRGGEDGSLQGLLEVAGVPYVGPSVLSSALCMDKVISKEVLRAAGLPVLPCIETSRARALAEPDELIERVESSFEYPVFVKPSRTGSSVGIHKARTRSELSYGIKEAARFDLDVLVEPAADVRELECAILGGHDPEASLLGEIVVSEHEFYDYRAKYLDDGTELLIPAPLGEELSSRMRAIAILAFRVLKCWGMARVDFFLERGSGEIYLNELNTLPGFTSASMYPLLWEATGVPLPELLHRLIQLALERHHEQGTLDLRYDE
jgi:D-alanine-D-alanine ligase